MTIGYVKINHLMTWHVQDLSSLCVYNFLQATSLGFLDSQRWFIYIYIYIYIYEYVCSQKVGYHDHKSLVIFSLSPCETMEMPPTTDITGTLGITSSLCVDLPYHGHIITLIHIIYHYTVLCYIVSYYTKQFITEKNLEKNKKTSYQ